MTPAGIICMIIFFLIAMIMFGIGISNLRSTTAVRFYTGEKAPEGIKDVAVWNKKHGMMWMIYGVVILLTYAAMYFIGDSVWSIVPFFAGVIVPLIVMPIYHESLLKKYKEC